MSGESVSAESRAVDSNLESMLATAKAAKSKVANLSHAVRNSALHKMADALLDLESKILAANEIDLQNATDLSASMRERLKLDNKKIASMAEALRQIAALKDPLGRVLDGWEADSKIRIEKVSVPIGVIGVIYESRPNVTSDVAAMCLKSGNVAVLKGGKEAFFSNCAITEALLAGASAVGIPNGAINLIKSVERETTLNFIRADKFVDLLIPRGGEGLVSFVAQNAAIPTIKHDKGVCHLFVERTADLKMALEIALNAKLQRPSVCNAIETLLVDSSVASEFLPSLRAAFDKCGAKILGDMSVAKIIAVDGAPEFDREFSESILNVVIVDGMEAALAHIAAHGSGHSEAIATSDLGAAERFLDEVDAACVYVNASTRFSDGGEFGFGAEVGISTARLHARGPVGIDALTTYKYKIRGDGQIRE